METTTSEKSRVESTIENWKRKLLDISKRNKALNFSPSKVTTLTIVDEQPGEIFRYLYLQKKTMRFAPAKEKPDVQNVVEENQQEISLDFVPYNSAELSDEHKDDVLKTSATPENLDKSLRRIDDQARASLDEQGVNTLFLALGMLHYKEAPSSEQMFRAPLILMPVALSRKNARAGYTVKITDDEPIVNPALSEYLRRSFGLSLPELPDLSNLPDEYDLQQFFLATMIAIEKQKDWQIKRDVYLSFFSFKKFTMYKDLEVNAGQFCDHKHICQIVHSSGSALRSLPPDIINAELDRVFAPETTAQVTNADSSQLRAILAVSQNHDVVIEGPPGTGKSQTITNLIAQAIADDKSVLFVAEKMAALEVVYNRMVNAGLGEFCLELHSTKASKRSVMAGIAAALDASLQRPKEESSAGALIGGVRAELTDYANALHQPFGALALSPYQGYGEFEKVRDAAKQKLSIKTEPVGREQLANVERDLGDLARVAHHIGVPAEHPWRDSSRTYYSEQDLDNVRDILTSLKTRLSRVKEMAAVISQNFGLPAIENFSDVQTASAIADVLGNSPGAPLAVLQSDLWNSPPPQATEVLQHGKKFQELRNRILSRFKPEIMDRDHVADITFIEAKENSPLRFLNFLSGSHKAIKNRWLNYRLPNYQGSLLQQAEEMQFIAQLHNEGKVIARHSADGSQLFGALWQGENSDWHALENYVNWVSKFRRICVGNGLQEKAIAIASNPHPNVSDILNTASEAAAANKELVELRTGVSWPADYLSDFSFTDIIARIDSLLTNLNLAPRWAAFEQARSKVATSIAAELLPALQKGELPAADLVRVFRRAFFQCWLNEAMQQRESLRTFHTLPHEERIAEFRRLDEQVLSENRRTLVGKRRNRTQQAIQGKELSDSLSFLRHQLTLQRGLAPLRITLKRSLPAVRAIKPVFMMSPLSVAQLLDAGYPPFDLVIFDEASQLPTEDAVGAIARGKQLVVVGDPKQLPPTNFFSVMSGTVSEETDEDGIPLFQDSESILEDFMGSGASMSRLKWHYRSAHESLINFSNVSFYDSDLFTFPSVQIDSNSHGLQFIYVSDGVYEGKGLNASEARQVADAVVEHIKTNPALSLGVGTFNLRQQIAIQDELELRRRHDPSIEFFFARDRKEAFFVKNLESIQGDERDVIFLSVTYGKNASGVMRYNFGPLNGQNGWRRLNVLITRARMNMRVFSSIKGSDINPASVISQGPQLLREFLTYAEHGKFASTTMANAAETENPFEREVYLDLSRRGLKLHPQLGVAGYKIDFAVSDDEVPGRYICGIECDGAAYHSSETARDRDRLRQQVLEGRGWTIHRLWSTDWFKDRDGQIDRLLKLIAHSKEVALEEKTAKETEVAMAAMQASEKTASTSIDDSDQSTDKPIPQAARYEFAMLPAIYIGQDLSDAPGAQISRAIDEVLAIEAPIHIKDLASRVASRWGNAVVGPNMMRRIRTVVENKAKNDEFRFQDDFIILPQKEIVVRTRAGTRIPAERIAPDEYRAAVLMILNNEEDGLDRRSLMSQVRALFGFSRTGQQLETSIDSAINKLLSDQIVGEASTGIKLRK